MKTLVVFLALFASAAEASNLYQTLNEPLETRVAVFKKEKTTAFPFLEKAAFNKTLTLQTRWRAVTSMGKIDPKHFRPTLEKALVSPEWFMRNAALIALRSATRAEAVTWSMRLVNDPALVVRTQAVRNLIEFDARESDGLLWKQVFAKSNFSGHESLWVRAHLAEALAKFSGPGQAKGFERLLLDPDTRLHRWAILGLENSTGFKIGDKDVPLEIRRRDWLARLGHEEI